MTVLPAHAVPGSFMWNADGSFYTPKPGFTGSDAFVI